MIITFSIREVLLCICARFALTLREERVLKPFELNWKLRRLFDSERVQVRNAWCKLHYQAVHNACSSQNIFTVI